MKRSEILEEIRLKMKNEKWYTKFYRWINLQIWLLNCLLFNNRVCRYFKYRKIRKTMYVVPDERLRDILRQFGYNYMTDKQLFTQPNLKWFYENLKVRHLHHELYIEAMGRIEKLLD